MKGRKGWRLQPRASPITTIKGARIERRARSSTHGQAGGLGCEASSFTVARLSRSWSRNVLLLQRTKLHRLDIYQRSTVAGRPTTAAATLLRYHFPFLRTGCGGAPE